MVVSRAVRETTTSSPTTPMIFLKIIVTVILVTGLSVIAERVSPRAAGVLSGYPAGSAIALFFIGLEQGAVFAGQSAPYNVAGLTAMLVFLLAYYHVSARVRRWTILASSAAAVSAFLAGVSLISALGLPVWGGILMTAVAIPATILLFRAVPNAQIANRVRFGPRVLLFRASLAALVIVLITGVAELVGPRLAGLFSAFPATIFPLLLIVHSTYGVAQVHTVAKNVPQGLGALMLYSITVSYSYPALGVYWGTLAAFGVATVYLMVIAVINGRRLKERLQGRFPAARQP